MTVNEMIILALTTDSRKHKARYQSELENLGYKIYKDRCWGLRNPVNNRWVELRYNESVIYTNMKEIRFGYVWSNKIHNYKNKPINVIDFEGLLNKRAVSGYSFNYTTYEQLNHALRNKKYHQDKLDNAWGDFQNEMNLLMKKMEQAKKNYEREIEYHTKYANNAQLEINKILKKS